MTAETIRLLAGVLFLLIAVVGGGFTVKELSIPQVPQWGRVLAGALGAAFTIPLLLNVAGPADVEPAAQDEVAAPDPGVVEAAPGTDGTVVLHEDDDIDTSPESISLIRLAATSAQTPVRVGDRITVTFTIENVGETAFPLADTFIGARDPDEDHRDFGESNHGNELDPGERASVRSSILADEAGTWQFWPCYTYSEDGADAHCPSEWASFPVLVQQ